MQKSFSIAEFTDALSKDCELKEKFSELCDFLDMDYGIYCVVNAFKFHLPACSTYPTDWRRTYQQEGYSARDPLVPLANSHRVPIILDGYEENDDFHDIWIRHAGEFGINQPRLLMPFYGPSKQAIAMVFSGKEIASGGGSRNLFLRKAEQACRDFHEDVMSQFGLDEIQGTGNLSARERQVLELNAEGMRAQDIADTLKISKKAVEEYTRNAKKKMECKTVQQATYVAGVYGMIYPRLNIMKMPQR